ncbi:hypothetical protein Pla108_19590 [Botrimarina colliarenosi]|uniref:Dockerin domain-containing protein n=1 Tax=Botrimarina colliarenosi TaxID=2528001 RepID=A0A5C6AEG9_9BACT|nr:family 10 glycosylhydrolase [Botrimarina colliarenosi]TWT97807.1 hypothetical protein Pla108_19590 [Botrimarina colliarenosi]
MRSFSLTAVVPATALLLVATAAAISPAHADESFGDWRGLWINRFEYNPNSVASIQSRIENAAAMGITDVLWQVRGQADALYDSGFETPAQSWNQTIDPLQVAIDTAHANGVRLHAWLNTMPVWNGTTAPQDPNHVFYNTDPSFRVTDINGNLEPIDGGYVKINHVLPEVQQHLNNVVSDLATNYDLDGVHLDYIRWLGPGAGSSEGFRPDWNYLPHDDDAHALYLQQTGLDATDGSTFAKREAYRTWVEGRITDLVTTVGQTVNAIESDSGRTIKLSAAVWNNPTTASNQYLQDYRTWLEQDLLDVAIPMVYLSENNRYLMDGFLDDIFATPTNTDVSIGLGTYLHTNSGGGVDETITQMQQVYDDGRAASLTYYGYGSLLDGSTLSSQRRDAVVDWYAGLPSPVEPPRAALAAGSVVIDGFDTAGDNGYFDSNIDTAFQTTGLNPGSSAAQTSDVGHYSEGSQRLSIDADGAWTIRHLSGGADPAGNAPIVTEGFVGFWLKTETPGISVQIALDDPVSADRGVPQQLIADGQWRLYEWDLEDDSQWLGWVNGDGAITGPTATIDSIFFTGEGDAEVYLDTVAYNSEGSLFAPVVAGDYDGDGVVSPSDYLVWRNSYGRAGSGHAADGNEDGVVDAADYSTWRDALAGPANAVPEPCTALIGVIAIGMVIAIRRA